MFSQSENIVKNPTIERIIKNTNKRLVTGAILVLKCLNLYEWWRATRKNPHNMASMNIYIPKYIGNILLKIGIK